MKYKSLEEYRNAQRERGMRYYNKKKDDPEFKEKRRIKARESYRKMIDDLKKLPL